MLSFDIAFRLAQLQARLKAATYHELRKDGHHKSSEGALSLSFSLPPVVGDRRDSYWTVEAYSYLLCPSGRQDSWSGKSPEEALAKAEDDIGEWCRSAEMEMFGVAMGMCPLCGEPDDKPDGEPLGAEPF